MNYPKDLKYVKSHEWIRKEADGMVVIGITDYAQDALGDLVFVNLPEIGDEISLGNPFADVESVKAVSEIFSPVTGYVAEINEELLDSPELINEDPYEAWFIKVERISEEEDYMDAQSYEAYADQL
ncbi:glycine cleavage system protein GcvH [uncultured Robinsoniella sp.]|uniref:glycine cleavage system protein GcvH n=1 Tax=uncultured Robinsoniella sp. TaxID=904190 RepID=UPI00374E9AFF